MPPLAGLERGICADFECGSRINLGQWLSAVTASQRCENSPHPAPQQWSQRSRLGRGKRNCAANHDQFVAAVAACDQLGTLDRPRTPLMITSTVSRYVPRRVVACLVVDRMLDELRQAALT